MNFAAIRKKIMPMRSIPEVNRREFGESLDRVNLPRGKVTALAFIFMEVSILLIMSILRRDEMLRGPGRYYTLMYVLMLVVMPVFYVRFNRLQKNMTENGREIQTTGVCFALFLLVWCAGISLMDQTRSGQLMVYTVAVIAIGVAPLFRPLTMLQIYMPVHAVFLIVLMVFKPTHELPLGTIINSTAFVTISWAISYMRFNTHASSFYDRKLIEEKNSELKRINLELLAANEKLEQLSRTDCLTGVYNRGMFDRLLSAEWDRCRLQFRPLSIVMVDIDYFKLFNDNYGHLSGDACIRQVAGALSSCAERSSDMVTRYGGDEFAVILPCTQPKDAEALAELMRRKVEELDIPHGFSPVSGHVTISLGVYSAPPSKELSVEELIGNADKSLYEAKKRHNEVIIQNLA